MAPAPVTPQDLTDYLVYSHRQGYSMVPAMRTVRLIARNDRDMLHQVNALFDKYISGLPNGWQLVPTGRTINGLLDSLGPDLPSVR